MVDELDGAVGLARNILKTEPEFLKQIGAPENFSDDYLPIMIPWEKEPDPPRGEAVKVFRDGMMWRGFVDSVSLHYFADISTV